MPDGVRQHERFVNLAEENNGFLIALPGFSTILASRRLTSPPEFLCTGKQVDSIRVRIHVSLLVAKSIQPSMKPTEMSYTRKLESIRDVFRLGMPVTETVLYFDWELAQFGES